MLPRRSVWTLMIMRFFCFAEHVPIVSRLFTGTKQDSCCKRIENGHFQWPRNQSEVKKINAHQLRRLLAGFSVE
ncbi:hypothetical protein GKC77_05215 [Lactobacillus ruminis]|uniref:Uncharacterized protein n=1 Tax=Ligilactobacillus ruminis TaxID=1623 RepID=A0A6A8HGE7_9LACO|nr:hypothetical protein [Ligilactobacillus ruminis]MSA22679.1 hypothetical protein [Ligilactobacillus ruminis]MSA24523.1 hypothetical protein [Ligilactobacillus ruminis]MSA41687.1 hypothetical protein [Ligilactobacillus ruminis]MSA43126.1 hypothetical protein [Ligilactobacillus ruminis]